MNKISFYGKLIVNFKVVSKIKKFTPIFLSLLGKTMEMVHQGLKNPSRFAFDSAADHIYTLLLKKDCYPRFIRSEQYKNLLAIGLQPSHKKRFFGFGGANKKKPSTPAQPNTGLLSQVI
jgi:regulator of G-protein signaling